MPDTRHPNDTEVSGYRNSQIPTHTHTHTHTLARTQYEKFLLRENKIKHAEVQRVNIFVWRRRWRTGPDVLQEFLGRRRRGRQTTSTSISSTNKQLVCVCYLSTSKLPKDITNLTMMTGTRVIVLFLGQAGTKSSEEKQNNTRMQFRMGIRERERTWDTVRKIIHFVILHNSKQKK